MANRISGRADFNIDTAILDEHEYVVDALIDDLGVNCKIVYPAKDSECNNCVFDRDTGRSSGIYKTGGPVPFTNFTTCVVCGGIGKLYQEQTEVIKLRVYWKKGDWIKTDNTFLTSGNYAQIIGYMTNIIKIRRAKELILNSNLENIQEIRCQLVADIQPWGFRHNRYFVGYLKMV